MGIPLDIKHIPGIDKVYVLSVESFTNRIAHIRKLFNKYNLEFEFIFDHDIDQIHHNQLIQKKFSSSDLQLAHKSLILKHIKAWENCVLHNYKQILVLEDDVIFKKNFLDAIEKIVKKTAFLLPGYLIFLSGRDTKVSNEFLLSNDLLFKKEIPTADGYITDLYACKKRLDWLDNNQISLPADHLINLIHSQTGICTYWSREYLIEQGSVFGLFESTLDKKRQKKSYFFNYFRYFLKIFTRRILLTAILKIFLKKIK